MPESVFLEFELVTEKQRMKLRMTEMLAVFKEHLKK